MRIKIKYSVSKRPHQVVINKKEINKMLRKGALTLTQPTPKGTKTITIEGTKQELRDLAITLLINAK